MKPRNLLSSDSAVIDLLGGTGEVAKMFGIQPPSVSYWRLHGIPEARRMYLQAVHPSVFVKPDEVAVEQ